MHIHIYNLPDGLLKCDLSLQTSEKSPAESVFEANECRFTAMFALFRTLNSNNTSFFAFGLHDLNKQRSASLLHFHCTVTVFMSSSMLKTLCVCFALVCHKPYPFTLKGPEWFGTYSIGKLMHPVIFCNMVLRSSRLISKGTPLISVNILTYSLTGLTDWILNSSS